MSAFTTGQHGAATDGATTKEAARLSANARLCKPLDEPTNASCYRLLWWACRGVLANNLHHARLFPGFSLAALWLQYVRKRDPGDRQVGGGRLGLAGLAGVGAGGGDGSHVIGRDRSILKCRCDHDGEELCST